jgi:hypothetical protein
LKGKVLKSYFFNCYYKILGIQIILNFMSLKTKEFVKNQVMDKQKDLQEEDEVANEMEILEELLLPVKLDQKDSTEDLSLLEEEK